MKTTITGILLCLFVGAVQAQQTGVMQLYGCHFNEGKNVENLWQTIEMVRGLEYPAAGPPDEAAGSFVWLPSWSGMGYDYIWGLVNSDLTSMARGTEAFENSGNAALMGPRFAALGNCTGSISNFEQIKVGSIGTGADRERDAVVETFTCSMTNGADMDDVRELIDYWSKQTAKIESTAFESYDGNFVTPFRGGSGDWDWAWIGNSPDLMSFAQSSADYLASKEGQAVEARLAKISRCQSAVWDGYWIIPPANRM